MAQHSIPVLICDRCGKLSEAREASDHFAWGRIHVEQVNGPLGIGRGGQKPLFKDICPACLKWAVEWFSNPQEPRP